MHAHVQILYMYTRRHVQCTCACGSIPCFDPVLAYSLHMKVEISSNSKQRAVYLYSTCM